MLRKQKSKAGVVEKNMCGTSGETGRFQQTEECEGAFGQSLHTADRQIPKLSQLAVSAYVCELLACSTQSQRGEMTHRGRVESAPLCLFAGPESVQICHRVKLDPRCDPNAPVAQSADKFHGGAERQTANCFQVDPVISRAL